MNLPLLVAVIAGAAAVIQSTFNAIMVKEIGFLGTALIVGLVSALFSALLLFFGPGWALMTGLFELPLHVLLGGGLAGIAIVGGVGYVVSTLGVAGGLSLFIMTQLLLSVVFDHFGIFVPGRIPIDLYKIIGLMLMGFGVHLILR